MCDPQSSGALQRKVDIATGDVLAEKSVDDRYFAEGCTIVGDTVYQVCP